jgi:CRP/FNR family transcriptional regulator, cyclic AMP receptor protein
VADALGRTARYGKCSRRERQAFSQASTLLDVPAGTVLTRFGSIAREFAIVLTGAATVARPGGREYGLLAGDHFGEVALLYGGPTQATVVAATPMKLAIVGPKDFETVLERCPTVVRAVLDGLAGHLHVPSAAPKVYSSSVKWKERGFAAAVLSAVPRSTQKSLPSMSVSQTQPVPSSLR